MVPASAGSNPAAPAPPAAAARAAARAAAALLAAALLAAAAPPASAQKDDASGAEAEARGAGAAEAPRLGIESVDPPLPAGHPLLPAIARDWHRTDFSRRAAPLESIRSGGPPRDGIPAVDEPTFVPALEADLGESEPVVRLSLGGETRGYPLRVLTWHEIVNDEVGGVPVAVTYCPLCNTSVVFDRRLDGRAARFGTTGLLRNSDLVMYDDREESWWQQYGGEAIVGARVGETLKALPSRVTSYAALLEEDRSMPILAPTSEGLRPYGANPYVGYDSSSRPFLFDGETPEGIEPLAYVVAVGDRAWALDALREAGELDAGGGLTLRWRAGLNSALDSRRIDEGRDIGRVEATRGGAEAEHKITFAFVFHAFEEKGTIFRAGGEAPIAWDRRPAAPGAGGEAGADGAAGSGAAGAGGEEQ